MRFASPQIRVVPEKDGREPVASLRAYGRGPMLGRVVAKSQIERAASYAAVSSGSSEFRDLVGLVRRCEGHVIAAAVHMRWLRKYAASLFTRRSNRSGFIAS
jgi:hypothetical protein